MTLVTTCPSCETSFRVVADQLKLRRGLVRCGQCRTVFSGLERLRRLEEDTGAGPPTAPEPEPDSGPLPSFGAPAAEMAPPPPGEAARPEGEIGQADDDAGPEDYAPWRPGEPHADDGHAHDELPDPGHAEHRYTDDETSPMTLAVESPETLPLEDEATPRETFGEAWRAQWPDVAPSNLFRTPPARRAAGYGETPPDEPASAAAPQVAAGLAPAARPAPGRAGLHDEDQRFAEELEAVAQELEAWDDGESAIDYFSAERQRRGFVGRNGGWKLLGAAALVLLLGLQAMFASRDWLAARFPALEPMIATLGAPFGLSVELPRALDSLAIESFELQAAGRPGLFSVSAIVRNDASHAVRWPSMLLTLTDPGNRVLLRKAIDPADYLPPATVESGLRPRSERPIRLALEADEVQPAGYSVTLFYR